jgi:hypothetical protein
VHKSLSSTTDKNKSKSVFLPENKEGILETSGLEGIANLAF